MLLLKPLGLAWYIWFGKRGSFGWHILHVLHIPRTLHILHIMHNLHILHRIFCIFLILSIFCIFVRGKNRRPREAGNEEIIIGMSNNMMWSYISSVNHNVSANSRVSTAQVPFQKT